MKKLFLTLMLLGISFAATAQAYIGGTLGIAIEHASSEGYSGTKSAFSISPEGGYNFNRTLALGASLGVQYQDPTGVGITTFSILPYVRATFARASVFDFFAELAMGYAHESADGYGVGGFVAGLRPGFVAHLSDKFSLIGRTTLFSYSHYDGIDGIGFAINSNLALGVQFTF